MNTNENKLLTSRDIAKVLGISYNSSLAIMRTPGFPAIKIGRKYLVREERLEKWLTNNEGREVIING